MGELMTEPRAVTAPPAADAARDEHDVLRASVYSLIAALLGRIPDAVTLALLARIPQDAEEAGSGMAAAWRMLAQAGERADRDALDDEYHALFIGIGRGELVPYGSWYLTGFLMEQPLALLRRDLARLGFERQPDVREPEDHAAALCETMALLIGGDEAAGLDQQREFFERHLAPWMGRFFRDMQGAESARFYRAVGYFGEQFMTIEQQYLGMAV
jgi:TorA maturation chaperone TorD